MPKLKLAHNTRISRLSSVLSLLFVLSLSTSVTAGEVSASPPNHAGDYRISVNVGLVVLPVTVTDRKGAFVPDLRPQDFQVYETGRLQQITSFRPEDVPVTVGLVVDNSGSMGPKRPAVIAASLAFVRSSNPQDQMFVVNFNQTVTLGLPESIPFSSDQQQLREALSKNPPAGNTALYDAIAAALQHLKAGTGDKKALIVVTDGGDNASQIKVPDLLRMAESSNSIIYTIGIFDQSDSNEKPDVLRQLSKLTGGQAYFPGSISEVFKVSEQISRDLRQQYTISYIPTDQNPDGRYRTIRVTAKASGKGKLYVRTRTGYLISSETPNTASLALTGSACAYLHHRGENGRKGQMFGSSVNSRVEGEFNQHVKTMAAVTSEKREAAAKAAAQPLVGRQSSMKWLRNIAAPERTFLLLCSAVCFFSY